MRGTASALVLSILATIAVADPAEPPEIWIDCAWTLARAPHGFTLSAEVRALQYRNGRGQPDEVIAESEDSYAIAADRRGTAGTATFLRPPPLLVDGYPVALVGASLDWGRDRARNTIITPSQPGQSQVHWSDRVNFDRDAENIYHSTFGIRVAVAPPSYRTETFATAAEALARGVGLPPDALRFVGYRPALETLLEFRRRERPVAGFRFRPLVPAVPPPLYGNRFLAALPGIMFRPIPLVSVGIALGAGTTDAGTTETAVTAFLRAMRFAPVGAILLGDESVRVTPVDSEAEIRGYSFRFWGGPGPEGDLVAIDVHELASLSTYSFVVRRAR